MSILDTPLLPGTESSNTHLLAEGQFPAIVVGLVVQDLPKFNEDKSAPVELEHKVSFVWQVHGKVHQEDDAEGEAESLIRHIKSIPYKVSTHEKSGLMKFLMKWSKSNTPQEVIDKLKDPTSGELQLKMLIGKLALLTITHKESKGKTYAEIDTIGLPKKSQLVKFDAESEVPVHLHSPKVAYVASKWLEGVKFAKAKETESVQTNQVVETEVDDDSDMPF